MCFLTLLALVIVLYTFLYVIALLFFDCDLRLAWAEKFGKPIGKCEKYILCNYINVDHNCDTHVQPL
jgi:hypothetical protein